MDPETENDPPTPDYREENYHSYFLESEASEY